MTSDEGLNAYGAATWGQFFVYQGFNAHAGWMHTSTGADTVDEFAETDRAAAAASCSTATASALRPVAVSHDHACPTGRRAAMASKDVHGLPHPPRPDRPRGGRQVDRDRADAEADRGAEPVVPAHQGAPTSPRSARSMELHGQLLEQHDLRRRQGRDRLLPSAVRAPARRSLRLDPARSTAAIRRPTGRACTASRTARTSSTRRTAG